MAKQDFCFTYYDGDAARDKAHMTRLERGGYDDIISAQRKFGRLTIEMVRRVLGSDFVACWPSIEIILKKDDAEKYYIEWVENSVEKMKNAAQKQKEKIDSYWAGVKRGEIPRNNKKESVVIPQYEKMNTAVIPLENGNGNEYTLKEKGVEKENFLSVDALVPEMATAFLELNPQYPFDQLTDYPALRQVAEKILGWQKISGSLGEKHIREMICLRWGELLSHIKQDSHLCRYSITQINKHFQSIVQSLSHGNKHIQNRKNPTHRATITGAATGAGTL